MNTLICAGGSSLRVLNAVMHLCSLGLGPKEMSVLVIDPDAAHGNAAEVRQLCELYTRCRKAFGGELASDLRLFGTNVDLLDTDGGSEGLKIWSPLDAGVKLIDIINYYNLTASETPRDVAHLFFTKAELEMPLDRGFMGHTAVGAAAMALVSLSKSAQPWRQIVERIRADVSRPEGANVFIVGSVFGGTGASAIHPITRFIRSIPETNHAHLRVGAAALVPYFSFDDGKRTEGQQRSPLAAQAQWFPLRTRSAVAHYRHLEQYGDLELDVVHWVGDSSPVPVEYSEGGSRQRNPAHVVDLLAALACIEFFAETSNERGSRYAAKHDTGDESLASVKWHDIPLNVLKVDEVQRKMLGFIVAGAMHVGFYAPLFESGVADSSPFCLPWYLRRHAARGDHFIASENLEHLRMLTALLRGHYFPWWADINSGDHVTLFNKSCFQKSGAFTDVALDQLSNLLPPDRPSARTLDCVDEFAADMETIPLRAGGRSGVGAYLSVLAYAADRFASRRYHIRTAGPLA